MRRWLFVVVTAAVLGLGTACSSSPGESVPSNTPPASTGPLESSSPGWTRYAQPAKMCDAVDTAALKDIYPTEEPNSEHLLNTSRSCSTALIDGHHVLGLAVETDLVTDHALAVDPNIGRELYDTSRRLASDTPTDIDGIGSAAFWYGDQYHMTLVTYDGNISMTIHADVVNQTHTLASDMPARLGQVATATLLRLRV
ncbi:MAG TPA: hypothetical protein VH561_20475 [Micromonosporaceae bacterium]|jgi:hypothetical protein